MKQLPQVLTAKQLTNQDNKIAARGFTSSGFLFYKMNPEFEKAGRGQDWLSWLGQPMLYDGGLCVNRTPEEVAFSLMIYGKYPLLEV